MIAAGDQQPERQPDDDDERRHDEVEHALRRPVDAREDRRAQLEERDRLPGDVLGALREDLGGRRRDAHLHAALVRLLDELDELVVGHVAAVHDQLVDGCFREHARQVVERAEPRERDPVLRRRDRADELVVDPAARLAERAQQVRDVVALADQHRAAAHAEQVHDVARDPLVARAQEADERRAGDDGRRREPVRPELVVDAPREDDRQHRDEHERRDDAADAGAAARARRRGRPARRRGS